MLKSPVWNQTMDSSGKLEIPSDFRDFLGRQPGTQFSLSIYDNGKCVAIRETEPRCSPCQLQRSNAELIHFWRGAICRDCAEKVAEALSEE